MIRRAKRKIDRGAGAETRDEMRHAMLLQTAKLD